MRTVLTAVLACGVALAAQAPKEKEKPAKDEDAIKGTWVLDKFEGDDKPPVDLDKIKFTFKDGEVTIDLDGQSPPAGKYKIDPSAKVKTIDVTTAKRTTPGIYELTGDTLKLCLATGEEAARPTEFKADGRKVAVLTLKRVKDK